MPAVRLGSGCPASGASAVHVGSDPAVGTPPLLWHGGPVMATRSTGPLVVTPIYWTPAGHSLDSAYMRIISRYVHDVAEDSGTRGNVYATLTEFFGSNGASRYRVKAGRQVVDTSPLPANGCTVEATDTANIYADGSGYDACLDDAQVVAEIQAIVTANGLPRDYGHIYVLFLPKHVESCFSPGSSATANGCTINHQPTAAYCAYHSQASATTVYANMPFPIYSSAVGFTCGSDGRFPVIQTPNRNADADTELSPTSHEVMEAATDPDVSTGWYDANGFENGDECAYVYGPTQGPAGRFYNQVINERHYLTQEEFSNADFAATGGGCVQREPRR